MVTTTNQSNIEVSYKIQGVNPLETTFRINAPTQSTTTAV
jgi:hypothetical protein